MTSWRDTASTLVQADFDNLLNPALGFAQQQLDKHGEFFPYVVVVRTDNEAELVAARPDAADDGPKARDVVAACRITVAERRDQLRAVAVVANVQLPSGEDAIRVELEHSEGPALTLLLTYSHKRFGRGITYGQMQAGKGARHIWLD